MSANNFILIKEKMCEIAEAELLKIKKLYCDLILKP